jgi:hypothetical protein
MTAHSKSHMQNEHKSEIGMWHCNRKWNYPHLVIYAQHCALQQRRQLTKQR